MLSGLLALTTAAIFAGAAFYVGFAEHPARMKLPVTAALTQWKPSYARGYSMQATLAIIGFLFGVAAWWQDRDWLWLAGAGALLANWPYTLLVIMPTNNRLKAIAPEAANEETRTLLVAWGNLHAFRTALGIGSTILFIAASS